MKKKIGKNKNPFLEDREILELAFSRRYGKRYRTRRIKQNDVCCPRYTLRSVVSTFWVNKKKGLELLDYEKMDVLRGMLMFLFSEDIIC